MWQKNQGFTIIEALIVIAIAGLVMAMVFLAIPAAQRNSRNLQRKRTADVIRAQIVQYRADTGRVPTTTSDGAEFIDNYLTDVPTYYTVTFRDNSGSHSDKPPIDEFYIQYGHWCSAHGGADQPGDPIAASPGSHEGNQYFAVYTRLEKNAQFCLDNG